MYINNLVNGTACRLPRESITISDLSSVSTVYITLLLSCKNVVTQLNVYVPGVTSSGTVFLSGRITGALMYKLNKCTCNTDQYRN